MMLSKICCQNKSLYLASDGMEAYIDQWEVINTHSTAWFIIRIANSYASPFSTYYLVRKAGKTHESGNGLPAECSV